jgi:hypothetical protein
LGINTCLYCNRNHIHYDYGKKIGTTLDHFYDKATYLYLALSFYNLIPSCYSCNTQLKGSKLFTIETHLHPYEKGFEGILHFKTNVTNVDDIIAADNTKINIVLDERADENPLKEDLERAKIIYVKTKVLCLKSSSKSIKVLLKTSWNGLKDIQKYNQNIFINLGLM